MKKQPSKVGVIVNFYLVSVVVDMSIKEFEKANKSEVKSKIYDAIRKSKTIPEVEYYYRLKG